jgi:1,4-dihydroxy-2-naphthoate octaprenyltransferase
MADKKEFSARKFMAVWFSSVYGIIMLVITYALALKIVNVETYIALLGAFALIVKEIVNDYFDQDRSQDKPKEETK